MAIERTLSIIKPDAVAKNVIGQIYARFEAAGLKVVAARMAHLSRREAEQFYAIRADFADSIDANAVHGSDAAETAQVEIAFFFPGMNVYAR